MNGEKMISLAFNAQRMDYIVNVLAQRPYAEVAPILADIQQQVMQQQAAPAPVGNGHDTTREALQQ